MPLQAFWFSSEPQEPLHEPHSRLAIPGHSAYPVNHKSHYMNLMQSYLYMGILGPQLALGATIYHCHVYLAIPSFLGPREP